MSSNNRTKARFLALLEMTGLALLTIQTIQTTLATQTVFQRSDFLIVIPRFTDLAFEDPVAVDGVGKNDREREAGSPEREFQRQPLGRGVVKGDVRRQGVGIKRRKEPEEPRQKKDDAEEEGTSFPSQAQAPAGSRKKKEG